MKNIGNESVSESESPKVLMCAFHCAPNAKSESYVGYQWARQAARVADTTVLTADRRAAEASELSTIHLPRALERVRRLAPRFFGGVKPEYFVFDRQAARRLASSFDSYDVFHHVTPIAPRYASALGRRARRFVLGPVGGGLRVPEPFRRSVESEEPWYAWLRKFDQARFTIDPSLRRTYDRADVLLLAARYMQEIIPERYHGKASYVLETGIDPADFDGCSSFRADDEQVMLLYVGRVVPYKGLHYLLSAVGALDARIRRRVRVTVVGDDRNPYGAHCRELCHQLNLADQVDFVGRLPRPAVTEYYARADVFCFPTLAETSGNVILEAMASGLPILTVRYGGPAEIVDSDCGILCEPISPAALVDALAAGLARLCSDHALRIRMGASARARALCVFGWDRKGELLRNIYASLL